MNKYQQKLKDVLLFSEAFYNAKYIGRTAYAQLGMSLKVKAVLVRVNTLRNFEGVELTVFNNDCVIDSVKFRFDDYFSLHEKYDGTKEFPHICIDKNDICWKSYPDVDELKKITRAIDDYVSLFSRKVRASVRYMRLFE